MKTLPFILFVLAIVLGVASVMSAPTAIDYEMHTSDQAVNNVLMLLVIAVLFIIGAIITSIDLKKSVSTR